MAQFDIMNDTVGEICKSLVEEPHRWEFDACAFMTHIQPIHYYAEVNKCINRMDLSLSKLAVATPLL